MKKLAVFLLLLAILPITNLYKTQTNPLFDCDNVTKVCVISTQNLGFKSGEVVVSGKKYYNFCTLEEANQKLKNYQKKMDGMQFYLTGMTVENVCDLLKCEVVTTQKIGQLEVICGYSPYEKESILIDGKKINVQIAVRDEVVVGFPMILTGY